MLRRRQPQRTGVFTSLPTDGHEHRSARSCSFAILVLVLGGIPVKPQTVPLRIQLHLGHTCHTTSYDHELYRGRDPFATNEFFFTAQRQDFLFLPFITIENWVYLQFITWRVHVLCICPASFFSLQFPCWGKRLAGCPGGRESLEMLRRKQPWLFWSLYYLLDEDSVSLLISWGSLQSYRSLLCLSFEPGPEEWSGKCFSVFSDLLLPSSWCTDPGCRYKLTARRLSFISNYIPGGDHNSHIGRYITYIWPINAHSCPLLSELFVSPFYFPEGAEGPRLSQGLITRTRAHCQSPVPIPDPIFEKTSPSISYLKWPYIQMQPWACCVCVLVYGSR